MIARRGLFLKYVVVLVALVSGALLASGGIELWFSYRENRESLLAIQNEKAIGAAASIEAFVREIERQMSWTTQPQLVAPSAALQQRRIDFYRLQRQVAPITELQYLDPTGKERLRVSRLSMEVIDSLTDFSREPRFIEARSRTWFGPVYFRKDSEPYMTIAMPASGGAGVVVAEVNLKFIWDVVSQIKVGASGRAFVVDGQGDLISHPDISLVLQKTSLARLPHIQAALSATADGEVPRAVDLQGREVLAAYSVIMPLRWAVFVEQPIEEAMVPLRASVTRTIVLILLGVAVSLIVSVVLARRMVRPIHTLQEGAARIGAGELGHRLDVRTGDELQALAAQFNDMTARLQESYATLERRVEERTRALSESLEQQTATAEILRVISGSPTDTRPVFETILESATRLCDANIAALFLYDGEFLRAAGHHNATPEFADYLSRSRLRPSHETTTRLAALECRTVHVHDLLNDPAFAPPSVHLQENVRTVLSVPMLREGSLVGVITTWRREVRPFTGAQVALVQTFADQAVIAIENVRLFTELQEKNRAVTEALEQQTATSEILRVISSSPTDVQPVFDTITRSAVKLCNAASSIVTTYDGELIHLSAVSNLSPEGAEALRRNFPVRPGRETGASRAILDRSVVQIPDTRADAELVLREAADTAQYRSVLVVPMLRDGKPIGTVNVHKAEPGPFSDDHVQLIKTFADQAVIAIENVRLFTELQQRTGELARTVGELEGLGEVSRRLSSTLDVDTILHTIVSRAAHLAGTDGCSIYRYDDATDSFVLRASYNVESGGELIEAQRGLAIPRGQGVIGRLADLRQAVQVSDISVAGAYEGPLRDVLLRSGYRSLLAVPMIREDRVTGGLVVSRKSPGEFSEQTVALLQRFATQSILALRNASLFRELEDKSRELEIANRHKSEFLANMSHELRTPLNAVIGFSEVLIERMFGDVNEKQEEYLRDIHSSGRHLLSLINDILDLAKIEAGRMELDVTRFDLPQAIENAMTLVRGRADAHAIRLEAEIDQRLGEFAGDERKFKQILLNLLSNAVKFTSEGGRVSLRAGLTNGTVEIAVTDTGIGIAPEDQQTVFEEFRQVGTDYARKREGTGLGLALTKRFVELHGGAIWLKSAPGEGSTFTFTLPVRPWPTSSS